MKFTGIYQPKNHFMSLLVGVIIGAVISFAPTALAAEVQEFVLKKVYYPILIDGKIAENPDKPLLNHEGTTYVPLKALGEMLNVEVTWNASKKQVEIRTNPQTDQGKPKEIEIEPRLDLKK